jgi:hypothetical protein
MSNLKIPTKISDISKYLTDKTDSDDVKLHQFSCENKNFLLFYIDCLTDKNALSLNVLKPLKTLCKFDFESVSKTLNAPEMKVLTTLPETLTNCFDGNAIGKDYARKEMETLFKQDYYMTVLGGRPLMYYFGDSKNLNAIKEDISYYRSLTKALGIPEPYAVIMNVSPEQALLAGFEKGLLYQMANVYFLT